MNGEASQAIYLLVQYRTQTQTAPTAAAAAAAANIWAQALALAAAAFKFQLVSGFFGRWVYCDCLGKTIVKPFAAWAQAKGLCGFRPPFFLIGSGC